MIDVKSLDETFLERSDRNYNYAHFTADKIPFDKFDGPRVGYRVDDYALYRLDGKEVKLSEIIGEKAVIEFASYSCPNYRAHLETVSELAETFCGVCFLVVYVREQHPGSNFFQHHSMSDKISSAVRLKEEFCERRDVFCDEISGGFHKAMGGMPNSCVVLNSKLEVEYIANWMVPRHLQYVLSGLVLDKADRPHDGVVAPDSVSMGVKFKTYMDCGVSSLKDVIASVPDIIKNKVKTRPRY